MNPDNKSPNQTTIQPDYSFITEQPIVQNIHKNNRKTVILVSIIGVLLLATLGLVIFSSTQNKVEKTSDSQTFGTAVTEAEIKKQKEIAQNYIELVSDESYDEARALLADEESRTEEQLVDEYENFWSKVGTDACKPQDDNSATGVKIECTFEDKPAFMNFNFTRDSNSFKIESYSYILNLGKSDD